MLNLLFKKEKNRSQPTKKILLTFFILLLFRLGNSIPLSGIDQGALSNSLAALKKGNPLIQIINIYSGSGTNFLVPFSLGIIPFVNSSILIDILTAIVPFFEKLQSEEGEFGRKKLRFYKKLLALVFSIFQSMFLLSYIKEYLYNSNFYNSVLIGMQLIIGAMILVWFSYIIDNKGIGNGTSLIILTNVITTLLNKQSFLENSNFKLSFFLEISFLFFLMFLICISQTARINIDVISARQLSILESAKQTLVSNKALKPMYDKKSGLAIRLNQAGIFPIIIASNIAPFLSFLGESIFGKVFETLIYYLLIVGFNYATVFWDPDKISEQLRKASVSIINITPGCETISYLNNVLLSTSILGGLFLCGILFIYDSTKQFINNPALSQLNISSLIIIVGIAHELQKALKALYKNSA